MIKRIGFLGAVLLLCFSLISCAAGEKDSVSAEGEQKGDMLTVWTFFERNTPGHYYLFLWDDLAEKMGISVDVKNYSVAEMEDKLSLALVTGELPDVFLMEDGTYLKDFVKAGACASVNSSLSRLSYREDYMPSQEDGASFVLPCMLHDYGVVYYNTELFKRLDLEIPNSFEELEATVTKVRQYNAQYKTSYSVLSFGGKDGYDGNLLMNMLLAAESNQRPAQDGDEETLEQSEVLAAAEKMASLSSLGAFSEGYMETGDEEAVTNFIRQNSLMLINHSSALSHLVWNMKNGFSVGLFPGSHRADGEYCIVRLNGDTPAGLCVNAEGLHQQEALQLCEEYVRRVDRENVAAGYRNMLTDTEEVSGSRVPQLIEVTELIEGAGKVDMPDAALEPEERNARIALIKDLYSRKSEPEKFAEEFMKLG